METMGSRVVPSGVGSLDNSLSHPITLRAPPPLPSPNLPNTTTTVSPCSLGSHHQSHYNDTITGFYWVNEERETERRRERQREGEREGTVGCSSHGGLCNHCAYFMGAQCHWSRRLWVSITNGIMLYFYGKLNTNKTHLLDVAWHFLHCIYFSSSR